MHSSRAAFSSLQTQQGLGLAAALLSLLVVVLEGLLEEARLLICIESEAGGEGVSGGVGLRKLGGWHWRVWGVGWWMGRDVLVEDMVVVCAIAAYAGELFSGFVVVVVWRRLRAQRRMRLATGSWPVTSTFA